ncbi:MAG: hypothetical protein ACJ74E_09845 [Actinomycetes bacterium]
MVVCGREASSATSELTEVELDECAGSCIDSVVQRIAEVVVGQVVVAAELGLVGEPRGRCQPRLPLVELPGGVKCLRESP